MKLISTFFIVVLLAGCNSADKPHEKPEVARELMKPLQLDSASIPTGLNVKGNIQEAWQWNDSLGENLMITTHVDPYEVKEKNEFDETGQTAELHVFHFIKNEAGYTQRWKISDKENNCPFDISAGFIPKTTTVTDLDNDGIAETTVVYKLACRSDVSPAFMKIIMHEDTAKYSLRGRMWIKAGEEDKFQVTENDMNLEKLPRKADEYDQETQSYGRYETEKEFNNVPASFLQHARSLWIKHVVERLE
jgi:hypothetical protein